MGTGYTFHCNNCGHDDIAMLGVGMLYPSVCDETLAAVRAGDCLHRGSTRSKIRPIYPSSVLHSSRYRSAEGSKSPCPKLVP